MKLIKMTRTDEQEPMYVQECLIEMIASHKSLTTVQFADMRITVRETVRELVDQIQAQ